MSLTRALLSATMESSMVDISGYNYNASMTSEYLDSACESLIKDIYDVDKAFMVADVVGECKVLTEGAEPALLLEGMMGDAFNKIKEGFKKFLAKIKAWFAKVKKFFQVLFMNGKELAKKYGDEIRKKSTKGFKYKGFEYKIDEGDKLVTDISEGVKKEIDKLTGGIENLKDLDESARQDALKSRSGDTKMSYANGAPETQMDLAEIESTLSGIKSDISSTDYQDKLISSICKGASDMSEMNEAISDKYKNGDTEKSEIEDFEANKPDEMLDFLKGFDKAIKDMEKEEKNFEKDVNLVIKSLDKISSMKDTVDGTKGADGKPMFTSTTTYKLASKISSLVSSALAVRKSACDKKVSIYKEINSSWTSVLKSFVLKKEVKESAFYEDFDSMIALTEAADVEPDMPEDDMSKDGATEGRCGAKEGKCGSKEGCTESASLLDAAYAYFV